MIKFVLKFTNKYQLEFDNLHWNLSINLICNEIYT